MTARPLAPVIPSSALPAGRQRAESPRYRPRAWQHVSRRALRSRGVKGSNEALNALALRLSAELAIDTVMCS